MDAEVGARRGRRVKVLVTGGAGFIGSHLVDALVAAGDEVRVVDDLSSGRADNLPMGVELVTGDLADENVAGRAVADVAVVYHLGAAGSVKRSIETPRFTDRSNSHGTLTILDAARHAGVRRVVTASSSSVYGGADMRPTPESAPLVPRSPYAVSKLAGEQYCRVFTELHGLETVVLRYFNVYGPRQRPGSPYAAVVPRFVDALRRGERPTIYGDGRQSRDFTFVADTVAATMAAASAPSARCSGRVFNVAGGVERTVADLLEILCGLFGVAPEADYTDRRPGDVVHSCADISAAREALGFDPGVPLEEGLRRTVATLEASAA
ncbi:MAG: NAD-dependent epimerase/dehydratase family protein [Actinomycetota bacterium]